MQNICTATILVATPDDGKSYRRTIVQPYLIGFPYRLEKPRLDKATEVPVLVLMASVGNDSAGAVCNHYDQIEMGERQYNQYNARILSDFVAKYDAIKADCDEKAIGNPLRAIMAYQDAVSSQYTLLDGFLLHTSYGEPYRPLSLTDFMYWYENMVFDMRVNYAHEENKEREEKHERELTNLRHQLETSKREYADYVSKMSVFLTE